MSRGLLRLRRRPSFWLGLFVACFLAWAWWDSGRNTSGFNLPVAHYRLGAQRAHGSTLLFLGTLHGGRHSSFYYWSDYYPEAWAKMRVSLEQAGFRCAEVPDFLVFFSFLGLWGGWLAWRNREQRTKPQPQ